MSIATTHRPDDQPLNQPQQGRSAGRRLSLVQDAARNQPSTLLAAHAVPRTVSYDLGVPTVHRTVLDFANFDHAATTPALVSVQAAAEQVQRTYG